MITFSFSPNGRWTYRQLQHVLPILDPEAEAMGLRLGVIEATTHNDKTPWFIIVVQCGTHGVPIAADSACPECIRR